MQCLSGCSPYPEKPPRPDAIGFVVGGDKTHHVFKKAGTHDTSAARCGCHRATGGSHPDGAIEVEREWFGSLSRVQQLAVLAHEHAHKAYDCCEDCADRCSGFLLASWGYTSASVRQAFASTVTGNPARAATAPDHAVEGHAAYSAGPRGLDAYQTSWGLYPARTDTAARGIDKTRGTSGTRGTATASRRLLTSAAPVVAKRATAPPQVAAAIIPATRNTPTLATPPVPRAPPLGDFGLDPGGPRPGGSPPAAPPGTNFDAADPTDIVGQLQETLAGTKINTSIVVSEVIAGIVVAFLVFVVFRFGGKS